MRVSDIVSRIARFLRTHEKKGNICSMVPRVISASLISAIILNLSNMVSDMIGVSRRFKEMDIKIREPKVLPVLDFLNIRAPRRNRSEIWMMSSK